MAASFIYRLNIASPERVQTVTLKPGINNLGRQPGSDVWLDDAQVSRNHARIHCYETECSLTDIGSSNGTYLHEKKLEPQAPVSINPGDVIRIGPFRLTLERLELPERRDQPPQVLEVAQPEPAEPKQPVAQEEPAPKKATSEIQQAPKKGRRSPGEPPKPPEIPAPPEAEAEGEPAVPVEYFIEDSRRLLNFLPGIYDTPFMERFLRIFESILLPIEWNIDNFDLFLAPSTAPTEFLGWLSNWYMITWGPDWSEAQRRAFLREAYAIFARRGTSWSLSRMLEIYTGVQPEIEDLAEDLEPFTFRVRLPLKLSQDHQKRIQRLIDQDKPAHTTYQLEFTG